MLNAGQIAPDFTGTDQDGNTISLSSFQGSRVILYFYPRDNTPGCTVEACNLRDNYDNLIKKGFKIIGISADSEKSHKGFANKHSLPFPLIADTEKAIIKAYGAWGQKKLMGRTFEGILRCTYVISKTGIIEKVIDKVKTGDHANQILDETNNF